VKPDNDWYGHKAVLADYAGVSGTPAIFGYVPHGWEPDFPGDGGRLVTSAPLFVWSDHHVAQLRERGGVNVRCIGAPISYLVRKAYGDDVPGPGTGTLCFPAHSAEGRVTNDIAELIAEVSAQFPPPYTVSIYYQDLDGPLDLYREAGWRITSFGSRANARFLPSLVAEIAAHEVVVANMMQTSVWYGALLGRRSVVVPTYTWPAPPDQVGDAARERWPEFYDYGIDLDRTIERARTELGFAHTLSPEDLAEALGWRSPVKRAIARSVRLAADIRYRPAPQDRRRPSGER
jgi:hypothetical protein